MSPIWITPFIIVARALQALGAVMSAQLRVSLSNPWLALTVLFAECLLLCWPLRRFTPPAANDGRS